ncbi:BadF/BadG/BcrA/BcrD ATPase family protein [Labrenzia sp. 011]|uniref:BadF/BadG/BcrA/BcrD ATPase family protein n=1 Tax=Labrenzia sp. 011 TaxID=2171494 RepID=UPI000D51C8A4|nr:BadF/BadG/BcrA/BcrD ATPase family protein [Labrenzia sp. 011]PVB60595.1 ATPase [Labrenzia sp. 011]
MSSPLSTYRIGIDGGGTHCRFALTTPGGRHECVLGSANVHTDFKGTMEVLKAGLNELADAAGLPRERLGAVPSYAGLAGVTDETAADEIRHALQMDCLIVADDRPSAVAGALDRADGTVAGVGTGSFLARQFAEEVTLLGGYGADLGDEASGCWLGKQLLVRLLHCRDGLKPDSPLISEIWSEFDNRVSAVLKYAREATPSGFAGLAPRLVDAAQSGDPNGLELMKLGAAYIEKCLSALGRPEGESICLIGGLGKHYAGYLSGQVAACLSEPKGTALDGALLLAETSSKRIQRAAL